MLFITSFSNLKYYCEEVVIVKQVILLLFTVVYIYLMKSKCIPSIVKNNITSFVVQTVISILAIIKACQSSPLLYECNSSIILYNKPTSGFYSKFIEQAYSSEYIIRGICIILYIVFGMLLIKHKSKLKDFLSIFICYIVLIIINQIIFPIYFDNIYVWVPYIFISKSTHIALQRATPLIYNSVFFLLLFVPTLLMWVGLELKGVYNNRFIKKE